MSTGVVYAKFTNKGIAGFTDFSTRLLGALRTSHIDSVKARFDVDGVFNTPHTLSAGGNDIVQVNGSDRSTDGLGHTLQIASAEGGNSALFENAVGIVYDVGARYAEIPVGISVNPRTGLPDYSATKEEIGESGAPDLVTDNGSTITFRVDTITESGVSNAGRTVRVYKLVPAAGATTEAIAIEDCTVVWTGSNNQITTTGLLGQTTVSTTASDYVVVMLGITVKRNTNLESSGNHLFIGQVTGVGAGSPPTVFDVSQQRLLKTFVDASQVAFTPYSWLTNTSVQNALQQVVDVLGDSGTSNPGAVRIGVNVVPFGKALPTAAADPAGGIGNLADSTFTAPVDLQDALAGIDAALRKRRAWTATFAGSLRTGGGDISSLELVDNGVGNGSLYSSGGTFFLQSTGSTYVYANAASPSTAESPYVVGENSGGASGSARTPVRLTAGNSDVHLAGKWQRILFNSINANTDNLKSSGSLCLDDCNFEGGLFKLGDINASDLIGVKITRTRFGGSTHSGAQTGVIAAGATSNDGVMWSTFEDCHFSAESATATAVIAFANIFATATYNEQRRIVFRNCVFSTDQNIPWFTGLSTGGKYNITFDGCVFITTGTAVCGLFGSPSSHISFRDCVFHDINGAGLNFTDCTLSNCRIEIGETAVNGTATLLAGSTSNIDNCLVNFHRANTSAQQMMDVSSWRITNSRILIIGSAQQLSNATQPQFDFNSCNLSDVTLDTNGAMMGTAAGGDMISFESCQVSNSTFSVPSGLTSTNTSAQLIEASFTELVNVNLQLFNTSQTNNHDGFRFDRCTIIALRYSFSVECEIGGEVFDFEQCQINGFKIIGGASAMKFDGAAGIRLTACTASGIDYTELTQNSAGAMVICGNLGGVDSFGGSLSNSRLQGGDSSGTFSGRVIAIIGDHHVVSGNAIEWSPPDDTQEAILISGDDNSFSVNTVHKDLTGGSATSANTAIDDTGISNDTALTHFSAA